MVVWTNFFHKQPKLPQSIGLKEFGWFLEKLVLGKMLGSGRLGCLSRSFCSCGRRLGCGAVFLSMSSSCRSCVRLLVCVVVFLVVLSSCCRCLRLVLEKIGFGENLGVGWRGCVPPSVRVVAVVFVWPWRCIGACVAWECNFLMLDGVCCVLCAVCCVLSRVVC